MQPVRHWPNTSDTGKPTSQRLEMDIKCPYYHKNISRNEADEKLHSAKSNGSFLIRDSSSTPNTYTLCLLYNDRVHQYRILTSEDKRLYVESMASGPQKVYENLSSLIDEYVRKNDKNGLRCALLNGIVCARDDEASEDDSDYGDDADFLNIKETASKPPPAGSTDLPLAAEKAATPQWSANYENDWMRDNSLVRQLRRKLLKIDGVSRADGEFIATVQQYLDWGFTEDCKAMQSDGRRAPTMPMHHLKKLVGEQGKTVVQELSLLSRKMEILSHLFSAETTEEKLSSPAEMDSAYAGLLAELCQCKHLLVNIEVQAVQVFSEAFVHTSTPPVPTVLERTFSIPEASFDVRLKAGLLGFCAYTLRVDVQVGRLFIVKSSATALDETSFVAVQKILQVIKSTANPVRLTLILNDRKKESYNFNDVRAREHFCQLVQQMKRMHTPTADIEQISVFIGTWNVGYAEPPVVGLPSWLRSSGMGKTRAAGLATVPHDVYAIGIQESGLSDKEWVQLIKKTLQTMFNIGFHMVGVCTLWSIKLLVLAKAEHKNKISHVKQDSVKTGLANALGNKGAAALSFHFEGTSFCFVNAHLTANTEKCERRNQNFRDIMKGLSSSSSSKTYADFDFTQQHHHVFWFGDLNYRVDDTITVVLERARKDEYDVLLTKDQLTKVKANNKAFHGFVEELITFPPSYRYQKGSRDVYHWRKEKKTAVKINTPSWCDRVLWKSYPNLHIQNTSYGLVKDVVTSDHKPVFASFNVGIIPTGSSQSQSGSVSSIGIVLKDLEVKIQTMEKEQDYQLAIASSCLEPATHIVLSTHHRWTEQDRSCTVQFEKIPELNPVVNDAAYVQDQHLLVAVKTAVSCDGEPYGACIVPLTDIFEGYQVKFKYDLTHMGEKTGEIKGVLVGRVSECSKVRHNQRRNKSIIIFTDNDCQSKWAELAGEDIADEGAGSPPSQRPPSEPTAKLRALANLEKAESLPLSNECHVPYNALKPVKFGLSTSLSLLPGLEAVSNSLPSNSPPSLPPRTGYRPLVDNHLSREPVPATLGACVAGSSAPELPARPTPSSLQVGHGGTAAADRLQKDKSPLLMRSGHSKPATSSGDASHKKSADVSSWLSGLGLQQYAAAFCANGWDDMEFMADISADDLIALGVGRQHTLIILDNIRLVRQQWRQM